MHLCEIFAGIRASEVRAKKSGITDSMVEVGVIAEGSVDQALSSKYCNRGIRILKKTLQGVCYGRVTMKKSGFQAVA